ncbi:MAG: helix-turn-helix domain-containing protein [Candidatus Magnetoovum sp. WYHC-5]|nr:helix-turn-helix domain-containing protein [Candidatus Magnetoovum sp. WYHC-5]
MAKNKAIDIDLQALQTMKWLTLQEACVYARVSENTLSGLVKDGHIYGRLVGGKWIIDRQSIDDYYNAERWQEQLAIMEIKRRYKRKVVI